MTTPQSIGLPSKFTHYRTTDKTQGLTQLDTSLSISLSDTRFDLLGAAPGTGKTLVNMGVAAIDDHKRVLYLVSTNQLLDQVYDEFQSMGVKIIKGMGNYKCNDSSYDIKCNEGKCLVGHICSLRSDGCDYFDDVGIAHDARIVLSNFAYRASCARYSDPTTIGEFDLIICDEAHLLRSWMSSFCAVKIDVRTISDLLGTTVVPDFNNHDIHVWVEWATTTISRLDIIAAKSGTEGFDTSIKQLSQLRQDLEIISQIDSSPWVVESWRYGVTLTPVEPGEFLERYIYLGVDKILLCSASLTESDAPLYNCGEGEYTFHTGGTGFPVERRPLIWVPTCNVKYKMSDEDLQALIDQIDCIIDLGIGYRGIIHSVSYDRMMWIYENSRHRDNMIIHKSSSRTNRVCDLNIAEALELYYNTNDGIIVSPVLGTGYDFKYSKARWQIISKIPWLNHTNPLVRARIDLWNRKYNLNYMQIQAAGTVLQIYGRVVRAIDDYGITYIVDNTWRNVSTSPSNPQWFTAAMETSWGLPPKMEVL